MAITRLPGIGLPPRAGSNDAGTIPSPFPNMETAPSTTPSTQPTTNPTNSNPYANYLYNGADPRTFRGDGISGNYDSWVNGTPTGPDDPRSMINDGISGNYRAWRDATPTQNASTFPTMQPQQGLLPASTTSPTSSASTTQPMNNYVPPQAPLIPATAPSYGVNQNTNVGSVNGVDTVNVNPTSMQGYQPFIDAAYRQTASRLDPQFEQRERQFRQQMVNQGLSEGTQAYDDAFANFSRDRNDAYASANNNAMGQGLAAQGQAFGQGAQQAQLAQAMRQWNDQFRLNQDNADLGAYGTLAGIDMAAYGLNQNANQQQFNNTQSLLGLIPNMSPNQVDVNGIYGLNQSAGQFNAQQNANANNGMWNAVGQIGAAYLSSEELKTVLKPLDNADALKAMNALPVDMWIYKEGDISVHIGTYSEQFYSAFGLPQRGEIAIVDMCGALHASIKALTERLEALEAK